MSKQEQVLGLEPKSELHFKGPFNDVVTSYLKLSNPSDRRVCFKVKTTAPKRYCVRPNNGLIEPFGHTTIAVMLQPVDLDNLNDKNKHKFMVQSVFAPEGDVNQENLWKEVTPDMVMDSKLKCVFDVLPNNNSNDTSGRPVTATTAPVLNSSQNTNNASIAEEVSVERGEDMKKVLDENKRLREELASIRSENLQLKEDGLKHRIRSGINSSISGDKLMQSEMTSSQKMSPNAGLPFTPQLLGIAVILLIAGVLLGKVLF